MDTFLQLQTTAQSDLSVGSESTLFPIGTVKLALNRAYRKAGGLFRWPATEDAKKTSTENGHEYYDYPTNWRPDSVWKLMVDGQDYGDPLVFKDYLYDSEEGLLSSLQYAWTSQWMRFFIYPIPTATGTNNISIWGQKVVDELSADADTTIFSYNMPECNDAIVMEAVAILRAKGEDLTTSQFKSQEAKQILATAWNKIRQDQAKYEKTRPMFDVQNMFPSNTGSNTSNGSPIGNF